MIFSESDAFMTERPSKDPLHGVTLEMMLTELVDHYGWDELGKRITIRCFTTDPSIRSSLTFLRRTPWARTKVERLYLKYLKALAKKNAAAVRSSSSGSTSGLKHP